MWKYYDSVVGNAVDQDGCGSGSRRSEILGIMRKKEKYMKRIYRVELLVPFDLLNEEEMCE